MTTADIIVLVLAAAIAVSLILTAATPYVLKEPISDERSKLLSAVVTAIVAIISLYIGAHFN